LIEAKIRNSRTVIREFARYQSASIDLETDALSDCIKQVNTAGSIEGIMGIEGSAAKSYFRALSRLTHPEFRFNGRSRNPPRDPFNAMLSYGYMLLFNDILTILQIHGLHSYVGFLHQLRNGHPALVSDLMEEWRPILVDSFCMHLVNRRTFKTTDFNSENGGVYLSKDQAKIYLERYEERIKKIHLNDEQKVEFNYRTQLENQVLLLVKSIEENDPSIYVPFLIR
jgi:CRISPR-associated protein Cas1